MRRIEPVGEIYLQLLVVATGWNAIISQPPCGIVDHRDRRDNSNREERCHVLQAAPDEQSQVFFSRIGKNRADAEDLYIYHATPTNGRTGYLLVLAELNQQGTAAARADAE